MKRLTKEEVLDLIDTIATVQLTFERLLPHNKGEVRRTELMDKVLFKAMVTEAIESELQPGGDIELEIPAVKKPWWGTMMANIGLSEKHSNVLMSPRFAWLELSMSQSSDIVSCVRRYRSRPYFFCTPLPVYASMRETVIR